MDISGLPGKSPNDFRDWEFVVVDQEIQKKLNQWRHLYKLRIVYGFSTGGMRDPALIIARKKFD